MMMMMKTRYDANGAHRNRIYRVLYGSKTNARNGQDRRRDDRVRQKIYGECGLVGWLVETVYLCFLEHTLYTNREKSSFFIYSLYKYL
jgi:hypothetical protein